jgi:phospholipid N-methyltransferase
MIIKFKDLTAFQRKWIAQLIESGSLMTVSPSTSFSSCGACKESETDLIEAATYAGTTGTITGVIDDDKRINNELIVIPHDRAYEREYDE